MSEWREHIRPDSSVWSVGVTGYIEERISQLTSICIDSDAPDKTIRDAQAAITELERMKAIPSQLRSTAEHSTRRTSREY